MKKKKQIKKISRHYYKEHRTSITLNNLLSNVHFFFLSIPHRQVSQEYLFSFSRNHVCVWYFNNDFDNQAPICKSKNR